MKRWEYSAGWKFLAVVLNQVCAVILVLSVIVCTVYLGSGGAADPAAESRGIRLAERQGNRYLL